MNLLDYITISFFAFGIICTGILFSKSGKTMKNFFSAGGAIPWGMAGLSLFMGFFSAGTFVVWGAIAYSFGWIAVTIQWTMCIAGLLVGAFIAPRWHKIGVLTAAEYINKRLGISVQKSYTLLFLLISLFTTGSFLYPVAKLLEVSTGLSLISCILLIGGICILYVTIGGLRAVVVTDVLQFIILFAAILIVIPLAFDKIGGVSNFIDSVPNTFFNLVNEEYSWGFIIAFGLYNAVFLGGNWAYIQRYTTVRTKEDARKVGYLFGGLYSFSPILWMLPAMIYFVVNPNLSGLSDEGAYLMMCKEVLPQGLLGLMLGGMIFATASSLNATLNISAAVFTNDVVKQLVLNMSDKKLVKVARYSTITFGIFAIVVALLIPFMGGVVNVVISVAALTGVPLYLPVLWTLFSKRQTGKSVLAVTLISLVVNIFFKFISPWMFDFSLNRADEMILGVGFPVLCLLGYELWAKMRSEVSLKYLEYEQLQVQYKQVKKEEDIQSYVETENDNRFSARVVGIGIVITGCTIIVLGVFNWYGREVVITVGGLLVVIGTMIYCLNKKKNDRTNF